uniref:Uncharacterized protein n=1 Tax=Oryza glumipatula TaxID=40148 RepID=A0A0E0B7M1_9ORYZ
MVISMRPHSQINAGGIATCRCRVSCEACNGFSQRNSMKGRTALRWRVGNPAPAASANVGGPSNKEVLNDELLKEALNDELLNLKVPAGLVVPSSINNCAKTTWWPRYMASASPFSCISIPELVMYRPSASSTTVDTRRISCCSLSSCFSEISWLEYLLRRKEMNRLTSSPVLGE